MANSLIDRKLYDAIVQFEEDENAQDYYYEVMNTETGRRKSSTTDCLMSRGCSHQIFLKENGLRSV